MSLLLLICVDYKWSVSGSCFAAYRIFLSFLFSWDIYQDIICSLWLWTGTDTTLFYHTPKAMLSKGISQELQADHLDSFFYNKKGINFTNYLSYVRGTLETCLPAIENRSWVPISLSISDIKVWVRLFRVTTRLWETAKGPIALRELAQLGGGRWVASTMQHWNIILAGSPHSASCPGNNPVTNRTKLCYMNH